MLCVAERVAGTFDFRPTKLFRNVKGLCQLCSVARDTRVPRPKSLKQKSYRIATALF